MNQWRLKKQVNIDFAVLQQISFALLQLASCLCGMQRRSTKHWVYKELIKIFHTMIRIYTVKYLTYSLDHNYIKNKQKHSGKRLDSIYVANGEK